MADKKERIRMTSPKGVAKYPRLSEPDTNYKKDGEFNVKLLLDADADTTKAFCAELKKLADEAFEEEKKNLKPVKAKTLELHVPFKEEVDSETGEPTGNIEFNFKTAATYKDKDDKVQKKSVPMFDAKGKKIERKVNVGGGSVLKVNFTPGGFYIANGNKAGVTLYLNAVQIIQLKEYSAGGNAEAFGFGKEEGYEDAEAEQFEDGAPADPAKSDF